MERAYQTNRRTVFCISFLSLQRPGWPSNRALKCGTLGKYEKPWETTAITAISPRKYLFWSRAISGETKKATPSDTLSISLKISRLVWLYGAGSGTRTHTMLPSTDFESVTSTNSIIPATGLQNIIHDIEAVGKSFRWRKIRK